MKESIEDITLQETDTIKPSVSVEVGSVDLNLVSHVDVELTALIGTASITLERLFSLKTGDTVKLNEHLNSDITLEIDNKPVALGKLVAVEECFGVEISEVFSKGK